MVFCCFSFFLKKSKLNVSLYKYNEVNKNIAIQNAKFATE